MTGRRSASISSWAERYIDPPKKEGLSTFKDVVARLGQTGFTTEILAGRHPLTADEPESVGGDDLGPSPYELLNAALGACTAMTLQLYARRKKWSLKEVKINLGHYQREYYYDAEDVNNPTKRLDRFERILELDGDLTPEQKKRLLIIANKCPVHKTLATANEFATRLLEDKNWIVTYGEGIDPDKLLSDDID